MARRKQQVAAANVSEPSSEKARAKTVDGKAPVAEASSTASCGEAAPAPPRPAGAETSPAQVPDAAVNSSSSTADDGAGAPSDGGASPPSSISGPGAPSGAGTVVKIPLALLDRHPKNPRLAFHDAMMGAMVAQMQARGSFDPAHAITVRTKPDGRFEIVHGHTRGESATRAGLDHIWAFVVDMGDEEAFLELALGNAQDPLSHLELALHSLDAASAAPGQPGLGLADYARRVGLQASNLSRYRNGAEVYRAVRAELATSDNFIRGCRDKAEQLASIAAAPRAEWVALVTWLVAVPHRTNAQVKAHVAEIAPPADTNAGTTNPPRGTVGSGVPAGQDDGSQPEPVGPPATSDSDALPTGKAPSPVAPGPDPLTTPPPPGAECAGNGDPAATEKRDEEAPRTAPSDMAPVPETAAAPVADPVCPPDILTALEAGDAREALTRITELRQRERQAATEIERLRAAVAKAQKELDTYIKGGAVSAVLKALGITTIKDALAAIQELKAHARR